MILCFHILPRLLLGRLAFVPDGVSKSMSNSRLKGPQFWLGHLWVGELQLLSPMYSTRPCCLVQAITWHMCWIQIWIRETACLIRPTLHLVGRWAAQTSRVQVLARAQPFPPLNPHYNHWPCVRSSLVGGSDKYRYCVATTEMIFFLSEV